MIVFFETLKETPATEAPKYEYLKSAFLKIINSHTQAKDKGLDKVGFEWVFFLFDSSKVFNLFLFSIPKIRYDSFIKGTLRFEDLQFGLDIRTQNTLQVLQTDCKNTFISTI